MKKTKFLLFTLIAVFTIGFAFNVNALEVTEDLTLSENVTTGIHVPSGANVTLDLNGYSVTGTEATTEASASNQATIVNEGTLIIKGQGTVVAAEGRYAVLNRDGNLTINNGSYSKENGDSSASLIVNGWYNGTENDDESYSEMLITGGSFDGGSYTAVKNDSYGKITIDGGAFTSTIVKGGIQDAGSSLTINGGTFDLPVLVDTLASKDGEVKSLRVNGGTFNGVFSVVPFNVSSTSETVTLASEIDVYITGMAKFNKDVSLINTNAPEDTLPVQIKQLDVKEFGTNLKIYGSASTQYPNLVLDGITVGNLLDLSCLKGAVVKNVTAKKIYAGNAEFINVKADEFTSKGKNVSTTLGEGTEIIKMPVMYNADTTIIVDGAKIGSVLANGGTPYKNFVVRSGSVDSIIATMGNFSIEGGEVGTITISNKSTAKVVTINVSEGAIVGIIDNQRAGNESATVETKIILPENYQLAEDGVVQYSIEDANVLGITNPAFYTGEAIIPNITVEVQKVIDGKTSKITLVKDTDYEVTFANNTEKGTATVTIKGIGAYFGTIEKTFEITDKKAIDDLVIADFVDKIYDGESKKQLIKIYDGDTQLVFGTDYRVINKDNVNAGTATVIITGKGKYTGKIEKTYKIKPANIVSSVAEGIVNKVYLGKPLTQSNLVLKRNGMTLVLGKDYKVSYEKNNAVGRAMIVVHGIGNYSGIKMKGFNIVPKRTSISGFTTYGNSITVSYKSVPGNVKYQIAYKQNGNRTYKYEKTSDTKLKARFLKYNMKYFFKVRPYKVVNGRTYYGAWSDVKTKTIVR